MKTNDISITCGKCKGELVLTGIRYGATHTRLCIAVYGYCISCGEVNIYPFYERLRLDERWFNKLKITTKGGKDENQLRMRGSS